VYLTGRDLTESYFPKKALSSALVWRGKDGKEENIEAGNGRTEVITQGKPIYFVKMLNQIPDFFFLLLFGL
jgi:hypothetical protein